MTLAWLSVITAVCVCLRHTISGQSSELVSFPDPGGTRRAWQQKRALAASDSPFASELRAQQDNVLTQPLKRTGPLDAERQAERQEEHDMYYRAIKRPKWQSKGGQAISAMPRTRKSDDLIQENLQNIYLNQLFYLAQARISYLSKYFVAS